MSKINLALGGISFDQGSFEEGDLPVYISRVFDRFTTGGFEVQLQRVLAAGGDELDRLDRGVVSFDVEMIAHRLAVCCESVQYQRYLIPQNKRFGNGLASEVTVVPSIRQFWGDYAPG